MFLPKLGVSLHTISRELTTELLDAVAGSRIETLEITPKLFDNDQQGEKKSMLKAALRRSKLRPMTIHALFGGSYNFSNLEEAAYRSAMAQMEGAWNLAVELNAPMIVIHASAEPVAPAERGLRLNQARRGLAEIEERSRRLGKKVAVELLPRTCLGNTVRELLDLLDGFDEKLVGICLDTNHLMDRYGRLSDEVRAMGNRLMALHLSDYDGVDEKHELPGKGVIDWKAFMRALAEADYGGPFNYECKLDGDTIEARIQSLERNFDWLSSLLCAAS